MSSNLTASASSGAKTILSLPPPIHRRLESSLVKLMQGDSPIQQDFGLPKNEPALIAADSVSWMVFKNPLALLIGGVTAVVLELAEPRVRTGVWEHTSFREHPMARLRRTGYAAMMTVYGPRSRTEPMIARVRRLHEGVRGLTPDGRPYCAADPELLTWVHATAGFGFLEAYHAFVRPLDVDQRTRFYEEGAPIARLYGAATPPTSAGSVEALFEEMSVHLESSDIVFEFLGIVRHMPLLPVPLRPLQGLIVRASLHTIAPKVRQRLGLDRRWDLASWERSLLRSVGKVADGLVLRTGPASQACLRLGLPEDYLYRARDQP